MVGHGSKIDGTRAVAAWESTHSLSDSDLAAKLQVVSYSHRLKAALKIPASLLAVERELVVRKAVGLRVLPSVDAVLDAVPLGTFVVYKIAASTVAASHTTVAW